MQTLELGVEQNQHRHPGGAAARMAVYCLSAFAISNPKSIRGQLNHLHQLQMFSL
jgi:hypothetical protein